LPSAYCILHTTCFFLITPAKDGIFGQHPVTLYGAGGK
jgi:hypothetical protein